MKLRILLLALFVAGIAASFAVAKPPPGKGSSGGNGNGKNASTAPAGSTTGTGATTTAAATLPTSGKVVLCHKTGQATKWVRISIAAKAAKQRIAKGDVWLQDPAGTCPGAAAKDHGSTTTAATTTAATTTAATTTTVGTTTTAP